MGILKLFGGRSQPPVVMDPAPNWRAPVASLEDAIRGKRVTSRLAANAINVGDLVLDSGIQILGSHEGGLVINNDQGIVWVSEGGFVKGDIDAPQVYVLGRVAGSIRGTLVVVEGYAQIDGEIFADQVHLRNVIDTKIVLRIRQRSVKNQDTAQPPLSVVVPIASTGNG